MDVMLDAGGFDSLIGRSFKGYRVTRYIARGGMGMVFEGIQESLNRPVAIKFLYPHLSDNAGLRDRFQREALAAARLSHPHIVRIIDFGVDGLLFYIVLDFVAGESLRELVVREHTAGRTLPRPTVERVLREIGGALTHAHALGLVHRDVKPSNILLTPDGRSFLTDFGVVKILGESPLTATGMLVGTPEYMAPEQASGEVELGPAADQYSFAVVAYELLVGRVPFQAPTPHAVIRMQLSEPPPAPSTVRAAFPHAAATVLLRGLAKDPAARYPTVDAFVDDLIWALAQPASAAGLGSAAPAAPTLADVAPERFAPATQPVTLPPAALPTSRASGSTAAGSPVVTGGGRRRFMLGAGIGVIALVLAVGGLLAAENRHSGGAPTPTAAPTAAVAGTNAAVAVVAAPTATAEPTPAATQPAGAAAAQAPTPTATQAPTAVPSPTAAQYAPTATVTAAPSSANTVIATIKVGGNPQSVAASEIAVWVTNGNDHSVSRIDPQTNKVVAVVSIGTAFPSYIALSPGAVWVAAGGSVVRIDPATNQVAATIVTGTSIGGLLAADGSVWAADYGAGVVHRIDPQTNKVVAHIPVGKRPLKLAATSAAIWVDDTYSSSIYRIDPNTNQVASTHQVGDTSAGDLATGSDALWAVTHQRSALYRLNAAGDRIAATIPLDQQAIEVATGFGAVWVTTAGNQVVRIDPQTNAVVASIPCGANPLGVAAGAGSIWVVNARDNTVARVQP